MSERWKVIPVCEFFVITTAVVVGTRWMQWQWGATRSFFSYFTSGMSMVEGHAHIEICFMRSGFRNDRDERSCNSAAPTWLDPNPHHVCATSPPQQCSNSSTLCKQTPMAVERLFKKTQTSHFRIAVWIIGSIALRRLLVCSPRKTNWSSFTNLFKSIHKPKQFRKLRIILHDASIDAYQKHVPNIQTLIHAKKEEEKNGWQRHDTSNKRAYSPPLIYIRPHMVSGLV
jgi:hypothetical protein